MFFSISNRSKTCWSGSSTPSPYLVDLIPILALNSKSLASRTSAANFDLATMSTNNAELARVALTYPAIDNHAHPLLAEVYRDAYAFEGLISEASPGPGLSHDATTSLACYRATLQLAKLYGINSEQWEEVKQVRQTMDYATLCRICMQPTRIQCLLLDDGLGGVAQYAENYKWHDGLTQSPTKRIVRVEVFAEVSGHNPKARVEYL